MQPRKQHTAAQDRTAQPRFFPEFMYRFLLRLGSALQQLPYEYHSSRTVFGLPLLSINLGFDNPDGHMRSARGVVAVGNDAVGLLAIGVFTARGLFALGTLSAGLVAVGAGSAGLVCASVFGLGLVSVSVLAVGAVAVGILAADWKSVGILAFGEQVTGITGFGNQMRVLFSWWQ